MEELGSPLRGGVTAERGDADAGGGRGDAAAEGMGCAADRGRTGVQPHDGPPVPGRGWLGSVSRQRPVANAGRA